MEIRITFDRIIGALTALAVLLILALGAGLLFSIRASVEELAASRAQIAAETSAKGIEQTMSLLVGALERAAAEPELAQAVLAGDTPAIRSAEERLVHALPGAVVVRLLPATVSTLDESRVPRMGYADLDLVRQAKGGTPAPAMHAAGTPDAHIAIARPLAGGRGFVLVSLAPSLLAALPPLANAFGAVELRQEALRLAVSGDQALTANPPRAEIAIAETPWKIAYWPPADPPLNLWLYLGLTGAIGLLVGLPGLFARHWVRGAMQQGQEAIIKLAKDLLAGKTPDDYPVKTDELRLVMTRLTQMKRTAAEPALRPESAAPALNVLPLEKVEVKAPGSKKPVAAVEIPSSLFRPFDIRGIAGKDLTPPVMQRLGLAIGSEIRGRDEQRVIVGRDGRLSSAELAAALIAGLKDSGCSVLDLGLVPTPLVYFGTQVLNTRSGIMVTGGHATPEINGLTILMGGELIQEQSIQKIRERLAKNDLAQGSGSVDHRDLVPDYVERIVEDIQIGRDLKIVVDCGNGAAGTVAPALLRALGCDIVTVSCEVDGNFPSHPPDPSVPENLTRLIDTVRREQADLGVAFDGDGDRLGIVDSAGTIIWPDRLLMLLAVDVLSREPGADIIFDVKCTRHLPGHIVRHGGRPLMWKSGLTVMRAKITETGALLAGDMSGQIFFNERWFGFNDGLYSCARLVEILSGDPRTTAEVFAELPDSPSTPALTIPIADGEGPILIENLKTLLLFPDARVTDIDGVRVDFADGFALVRASRTASALIARFEGETDLALERIEAQFRDLILEVKPELALPF